MATLESIAIRRADALDRAEKAAKRIAKATGADVTDFPAPHRDLDMRPAIEAEWLADTLETIAKAVKDGKASDPFGDADLPTPEELAARQAEAATAKTTADTPADAPQPPESDATPNDAPTPDKGKGKP